MTEDVKHGLHAAYGWSAARWTSELEKAEFRVKRLQEAHLDLVCRVFDEEYPFVQGRQPATALHRETRRMLHRMQIAQHSRECVRRIARVARRATRVYWLPELRMPKPPEGQKSNDNDNDSADTPREEEA